MQTGYYSLGDSRIHFSYWGRGRTLLICLHGYGESAESFAFLAEAIGGEYTVVAIDMPFHGKTEWRGGPSFQPGDLLPVIDHIVAGMPWVRGGWRLMGYSMGGRVALQLVEMIPEKIAGVVLIAPDGLVVNPWYWLATQTRWGNGLFRWTMRWPGWFFFFLRACHFFGMVNPSVYKFTKHYIGDRLVREELYKRWTVMRGFRPSLRAVRECIVSFRIPVKLVYGRYDRIIRWERGEQFRRGGLEPYCELILLEAGHQLLRPAHREVLVAALSRLG